MLRKTEEREIGGLKYRVAQLGGIKAREVQLRLIQCLGPSVGALVGNDFAGAFVALKSLGVADLAYFCDTFGEVSFVFTEDGKMPRIDKVFDDHFRGRTGDMWKWLLFCLELNYADFLGELRARIVGAIAKIAAEQGPSASPSMSPSTSTGSSGGSSPTPASA
jgi:hypothetical protein